MNYTVTLFENARAKWRQTIPAKSHKEAASLVQSFYSFDHLRVEGKTTVRRYNNKGKLVKGEPKLFKVTVTSRPCILLMVGNATEFIRYASKEARDKAFEEASCITSPSAGSVEVDLGPTDITVSSAEMSGSKTGSTEKKTWNGSAMSVTWLEKLTRLSIDKGSTGDKYVDMVKPVSTAGSPTARSRSKPSTLWATVKKVADFDADEKKALVGTTIEVKRVANGVFIGASGFAFASAALDFRKIIAKVISHSYNIGGQIVELHPCGDHYSTGDTCIPKKDLQIGVKMARTLMATVKHVEPWTTHDDTTFVAAMRKYIGMTVEFKPKGNGKWTFDGWTFHPDWLDTGMDVKNDVDVPKKLKAKVKWSCAEIAGKHTGGIYFNPNMVKYIGRTITVEKLGEVWDGEGWTWSDDWLEFESPERRRDVNRTVRKAVKAWSKYAALPNIGWNASS